MMPNAHGAGGRGALAGLAVAIATIGGLGLVSCGGSSSTAKAVPPVGSERGHCYHNGTCDPGLVCLSTFCVVLPDAGLPIEDSGTPGAGGAPSAGGAPGAGGTPSAGGAPGAGGASSNPADAGDASPPVTCVTGPGSGSPIPGKPIAIVTGLNSPSTIAVGGGSVYWATLGGTIMKAPAGGGTAIPLTTFNGQPSDLAVDGTGVYWTAMDVTSSTGQVMTVPITGGVATEIASAHSPTGIAVDGTSVYWADQGGVGGGSVMKMKKGGGVPTPVATQQVQPQGVAVDARNVYWVNFGGSVMMVPIAGGSPKTLALDLSGPGSGPAAVAVDCTYVYWALGGSAGAIRKVPINGGPTTTLVPAEGYPQGLHVDGTYLYWAFGSDFNGGGARRMPVGGGPVDTLGSGELWDLAIDANAAYWSDFTTGEILKVSPR